jgi:hypothetical protein
MLAPIGVAIFSPHFFRKTWPMRELHILVAHGRLLPIRYGFSTHEELVQSLCCSPHASVQGWEAFVRSVVRTTYIVRRDIYDVQLQQVASDFSR